MSTDELIQVATAANPTIPPQALAAAIPVAIDDALYAARDRGGNMHDAGAAAAVAALNAVWPRASTDELIDAAIARAESVPVGARPVVLVVRHPDESNQISTWPGDGGPYVINVDLGSSFDGTPDSPEQAAEFWDNYATELSELNQGGHPAAEALITVLVETCGPRP